MEGAGGSFTAFLTYAAAKTELSTFYRRIRFAYASLLISNLKRFQEIVSESFLVNIEGGEDDQAECDCF
ncbi:hypothetical protein MRB53_015376 [Persea americana]|uniref:Uncharacterized protein n=1 Tax=Persea americana TaxID=3435 RepID=A0ACC2KDJ1_PERAE|nr:hypothetical protein MRB53_015376 [Persea americana]